MCMLCGKRSATVRLAAIRACAAMWPPEMWWSISSIWFPTKNSALTCSRLNVSRTWLSVRTGGGEVTHASCR